MRATKKNKVIERFDRKEIMESANRDKSEVSFLNQKIIKYN